MQFRDRENEKKKVPRKEGKGEEEEEEGMKRESRGSEEEQGTLLV